MYKRLYMSIEKETTGQKVVLLGDSGVGKTSIVLRLSERVFRRNTAPTVGSGVITKEIETPSGPVTLSIWDTAGEERYKTFTSLYTQNAVGCVAVFDLTCTESFDALPNWIEIFEQNAEPDHIICVVGNKSDIEESRTVDYNKAFEWCENRGYKYSEVSAKTGENVDLVFSGIAIALGPRAMAETRIEPNDEKKCC
ncbi:small GTP-binding protein [Histomonas meleagridis]|uniref:small GTP-binding protein n=1 Tax=Histomonas meleagridis TaxID=135588 RepID=UPI00355A9713|nr:small GTP-binding protein [Histomonas meleagridis]KAH0799734.1 small GTP-binding protein [Histomonas meleagridis]